MTQVQTYPDLARPEAFTTANLGWVPWLEPLAADELTPRHLEGLVDPRRAESPYFALLARDPEVLGARTRADLDIFRTGAQGGAGLGRAERELAATVASRVNGCVFCASVHARFAAHYSGRGDDVDGLLRDGVPAWLAAGTDETWRAVVDAAAALTATPVAFGAASVASLRAAGLGDEAIGDVIASAAFFSWANRLMLSLGEPEVPAA